MNVRPYSPNPKREVIIQQYEEDIPLAFNVIYYVESPGDDALNSVMRQLADRAEPLFDDTEMQPQTFRLQYVTQSELKEENLRTGLSEVYDEKDVSEVANSLRHYLSDGKGGTLRHVVCRYSPIKMFSRTTMQCIHTLDFICPHPKRLPTTLAGSPLGPPN